MRDLFQPVQIIDDYFIARHPDQDVIFLQFSDGARHGCSVYAENIRDILLTVGDIKGQFFSVFAVKPKDESGNIDDIRIRPQAGQSSIFSPMVERRFWMICGYARMKSVPLKISLEKKQRSQSSTQTKVQSGLSTENVRASLKMAL